MDACKHAAEKDGSAALKPVPLPVASNAVILGATEVADEALLVDLCIAGWPGLSGPVQGNILALVQAEQKFPDQGGNLRLKVESRSSVMILFCASMRMMLQGNVDMAQLALASIAKQRMLCPGRAETIWHQHTIADGLP